MPKALSAGGIDIFYIDESAHRSLFVASAVRIPFLREQNNQWQIVWEDWLDRAIQWRRLISAGHHMRFRKEIHSSELLACKGLYHKTGRNLLPDEAVDACATCLRELAYLPDRSIVTTYATANSKLFGAVGFEACLIGLLQRLRTQTESEGRNGLVFFDEGHDEYVKIYRKAIRHLQTGSSFGKWSTGTATKNLPLSLFTKDANIKRSHFSLFIQAADLVAYTALQKLMAEHGLMTNKRVNRGHHTLYDLIPKAAINLAATKKRNDGIAPI